MPRFGERPDASAVSFSKEVHSPSLRPSSAPRHLRGRPQPVPQCERASEPGAFTPAAGAAERAAALRSPRRAAPAPHPEPPPQIPPSPPPLLSPNYLLTWSDSFMSLSLYLFYQTYPTSSLGSFWSFLNGASPTPIH